MNTKSERLEIRLDPQTLDKLDHWRSNEGLTLSRSEAVRRLLEIALTHNTKDGFRLNNSEKLSVWLLTSILKNQLSGPKDAFEREYETKQAQLIQDAIYGGHFWALDWELQGVIHDHADNPASVTAVVDILDVWSFIEEAYEKLTDEEKLKLATDLPYRGKNPKFSGFDGNNEGEYFSIAKFLVDKLERFQRFRGRDFNSHSPTFGRYNRMAIKFEPIRAKLIGRSLSLEEISFLLASD